MPNPPTVSKPKRGRVVTIFSRDCRFGLALGTPYILSVNSVQAAVWLLREFTPVEFVDPSNRLESSPEASSPFPFRTTKPIALPDTKDIFFQALTLTSKDKDLKSPEVLESILANASFLAVFNPLDDAASLRSQMCTEIAITVECSDREWQRLPKGQLDVRYIDVWDEFVRTYQMITADVRPPLWDDNHRLFVVKQGWVEYELAVAENEPFIRLNHTIPPVPIDRHQVSSTYSQDGTFQFDRATADEKMRRYLSENHPVPLGRETLSGAIRAVDLHRSGKTAVIECTIAVEVSVSQLVAAEKLKRGVSKRKLDEYKKEVGIGYQLNVDLPMLLAPLTLEERGLIGAVDAIRKRRNEVIHEGAQPDREEGQRAVKTVRDFLNFLHSRGHLV
jgi:hypothetical protein